MSLRVLVSAPYMLPVLGRFRSRFESVGIIVSVPPVRERLSEEELLGLMGDIDGVICGDDRFTASVLEAATPRLRVISKWGTGTDGVDLEAASRLGVKVCYTADAFTAPVADTTLGYVLSFARQIPWTTASMRQGSWEKRPGRALSETTLGIVGVGHIGSAVARRAAAFGMTMLGYDIRSIDEAVIRETGLASVALDQLLRRADYVTLHCDLNPSSRHLMDASAFALMQATAVLVNTARGPVVDERALTAALESGQIAGAALDVFETEPLPQDSPLRTMDHVLLGAHSSNSSPRAWEAVHESTLRNLFDALGVG